MLGIFLDTETNGLDVKIHKILEIAFKIVDVLDGSTVAAFSRLVAITPQDWEKSDRASLHVNGLSWEKVSQGFAREAVAHDIKSLFLLHDIVRGEAVFICQNPSFDRAFFSQLIDIQTQEAMQLPYHWLDLASMYWSYSMQRANEKKGPFPWETGFTKDKIAAHFHLPSEEHPHKAMQGVDHLLRCYKAVVGFPTQKSL